MSLAWLLRWFAAPSERFLLEELAWLGEGGRAPSILALDRFPQGPRHAVADALEPRLTVVPRAHHPEVLLASLPHLFRQGTLLPRSKDVARSAWLARHCRRRGIHHLHVHFAAEAAEHAWACHRLGGPSYSVTVHARDVHSPRPLTRSVLAEARGVRAISEDAARAARALDPTLMGERLRVIPLGTGIPISPSLAPVSNDFRLLCVARLIPKKGHGELLTALEILLESHPHMKLELVGDGPEGEPLEARVNASPRLAGKVVFHGALGDTAVDALYDPPPRVAVLSCRIMGDGDRDGIPVFLLEAMARRVPVVTTGTGGIPELIQDGVNGLLVSPSDPTALAVALARLVEDSALAHRLGEEGRRTVVERHDGRRQAERAWGAVEEWGGFPLS